MSQLVANCCLLFSLVVKNSQVAGGSQLRLSFPLLDEVLQTHVYAVFVRRDALFKHLQSTGNNGKLRDNLFEGQGEFFSRAGDATVVTVVVDSSDLSVAIVLSKCVASLYCTLLVRSRRLLGDRSRGLGVSFILNALRGRRLSGGFLMAYLCGNSGSSSGRAWPGLESWGTLR